MWGRGVGSVAHAALENPHPAKRRRDGTPNFRVLLRFRIAGWATRLTSSRESTPVTRIRRASASNSATIPIHKVLEPPGMAQQRPRTSVAAPGSSGSLDCCHPSATENASYHPSAEKSNQVRLGVGRVTRQRGNSRYSSVLVCANQD